MQLKIYVSLHYVCNICACLSGRERGKKEERKTIYNKTREQKRHISSKIFSLKQLLVKCTYNICTFLPIFFNDWI